MNLRTEEVEKPSHIYWQIYTGRDKLKADSDSNGRGQEMENRLLGIVI